MSTAAATVRTVPRPTAAPAGRPHLRVVAEPRRGARYLVTAMLVGGIGLFGVVGLHALAAEQSFQVRNLEEEVRELSLRYDELTAEIAGLESPERVRQVATGQLGMVPAREPGFLVAETSGSGDRDFIASRGTLRPSAGSPDDEDVADPVKQVLAAGR
jgi:cell division protein FtsB